MFNVRKFFLKSVEITSELVSVRRVWFQISIMSSQQIGGIEFCLMAHAVQVSLRSTRKISIYEMMPNAPPAQQLMIKIYD